MVLEDFWIKLLADRNDDAHHYNESSARTYAARIERGYLGKIDEFMAKVMSGNNCVSDLEVSKI